MKSFNIDLWLTLKNKLSEEATYLKDNIYFGLAPEAIAAPYCVMHVLDSGDDISTRTLCGDSIGISDIQFNIYSTNDMQLDELLQQLNKVIGNLTDLTEYRVIQALRQKTKNATSFNGQVGQGYTEFSFLYEEL